MTLYAQRTPVTEQRQAVIDRRWRWAALLLGAIVLNIGCNPTSLGYFLTLGQDDKIDAECKLAVPGKQVKLVILAAHSGLETRPELVPADGELALRLTQALAKRFEQNREKVKIISASQVKEFQDKHPDWREWAPREVGKAFDADYVVSLEINSMSLYEKGSYNRLYRGQTEIVLAVTDLSKPKGEDRKWDHIYTTTYPAARGPIEVEGGSVLLFRDLFLKHVAKELSRFFTAYPSDERFDTER